MSTGAGATMASSIQSGPGVFDRWAEVYDAQSNPLLKLEERCTLPLLPPLGGQDVLDVGCGTGRWLTRLEALGPASLKGIDCSATMLQRAREKVHPTTTLELNENSALPEDDALRSIVLASFVLSYVDDLQQFARECARILRPHGWLLISDMHPATAVERGWTRSFHADGERIEIAAHSRSIDEIVSVFQLHGFELEDLIEPPFAAPERAVFEDAGKFADFEELSGVAAIYIAKLQKREPRPAGTPAPGSRTLQLVNARVATGPLGWRDGSVLIEEGRIGSLSQGAEGSAATLNLEGYVLLPGLINAHEHLEFGLFPRVGRPTGRPPYQSSSEWAHEIHEVHAGPIELYRQIPKSDHLWWGAIRNLLCGVTTVCHHNPLHEELAQPDFPVRVLSRFGWSHSLAFDPDLAAKFHDTPTDHPFILHAAEGLDEESRKEIYRLDHMEVLDERTVLVHGLACTTDEIALINQRGTSLVICPTSNLFLFAKTIPASLLTSIDRVALGSDSPITAAGDLLDEIHYLSAEMGLDPKPIYNMVTTGPADIFHLADGQGRIVESGVADLIAIPDRDHTPAAALSELSFRDVQLVLLAGRVQMASAEMYERLTSNLRSGLELIEVAGLQRWIRSPLQDLITAAERVLGENNLWLAGREVRYAGTV
ncbi:Putative methyltransferase [Acidisarcina polymorpha]|uniref:Methyltransferase n=1 Tax=Acidisarcina polymorpha TaxID=2211140 RepID=A0A2Z5G1H5_9BACT|nr:amidohydrolase family protein [Acidisarcina polymorpha]AXC13033.1 Putative methyltransferase [Acidisarcina polymorpha]